MVTGIVVVLGILLFWFIMTWNRFVRLRNLIKQAWSDVDVQLKRRHDLIPKLLAAVKGYAAHERNTLAAVTEARSRCLQLPEGAERIAAEASLAAGLKQLFALAESYPELKADQSFLELQREISEIEDTIQMARRFYNGSVRLYNVQRESFPSLIVARIFDMPPAHYFELETGEGTSPELSFGGGA